VRIEQLEYPAEVARLGSFRRAAEELHISQPARSESVRSLERELGIDLLERGRHGATASDAGRELLPHILTVLDSVDRLRQAAGEQHRSIRMIRVGTVNAATVPLLTPAIRQSSRARAGPCSRPARWPLPRRSPGGRTATAAAPRPAGQ
jgi:DNA-binding transcriptional LysR family regulator